MTLQIYAPRIAAKPTTTVVGRPSRVAYLVSRFPKATETFVLFELLAIEKLGVKVDLYTLWRGDRKPIHSEAALMLPRVRTARYLSLFTLCANLYFLCCQPAAYLAALCRLLWANLGSARYFVAAVALFPKAVAFARSIQANQTHHIHAHFASHPAAAAFIIHRLTGIPYSFTAHGSDLHRDRHMLREKVAEAATVITISQYNRRVILAECPNDAAKINVVRCGTELRRFQPRDKCAGRQTGRHPLSIVCIGTLHEVKGQTHLIEACRLLMDRGIRIHCRLIGDGPDRAKLEAQSVALGLTGTVEFCGQKSRDDVIALLGKADIAVAPSVPTSDGRREGIPVAIMEAMACGIPVVASDLSGIPEIVIDEQNGLLCPPGDKHTLAASLERLIRDENLRRRLGDSARQTVEREYDLTENAARLAACFSRRVADA